jgi:hypothetical protein
MNLLFNEFIELLARRKFTKKKGVFGFRLPESGHIFLAVFLLNKGDI